MIAVACCHVLSLHYSQCNHCSSLFTTHAPSLQQVAIFSTANASTVLQQAGLGRLEVVLTSLLLHAASLFSAQRCCGQVSIFSTANASTVLQQAGLGRSEVVLTSPLLAAAVFIVVAKGGHLQHCKSVNAAAAGRLGMVESNADILAVG
jgi:hypothetical protein